MTENSRPLVTTKTNKGIDRPDVTKGQKDRGPQHKLRTKGVCHLTQNGRVTRTVEGAGRPSILETNEAE